MKYLLILIFSIFISNNLFSQSVDDSIPRLFIHASLNGNFSGEYSIDWIKQQNCLHIEIDTVMILKDINQYVDQKIKSTKRKIRNQRWIVIGFKESLININWSMKVICL